MNGATAQGAVDGKGFTNWMSGWEFKRDKHATRNPTQFVGRQASSPSSMPRLRRSLPSEVASFNRGASLLSLAPIIGVSPGDPPSRESARRWYRSPCPSLARHVDLKESGRVRVFRMVPQSVRMA